MIEYVYSGLLLIAMILLFFAVKNYRKTTDLLNSGRKTKAVVIELIAISGDDGYTYKPVFEFTGRNDEKITFKSEISSSPAPYKVGDRVHIIYNPNGEERKVISFWGLYRWTILFLCFASPLIIIGGGYFLYLRN